MLAQRRFHAGDVGIGLLMAARGVGALVGPFVGRARLGDKDRRLFRTIGVALAVFGAGYALLGVVPSLLLALPAVALAHTGGGAQWTLSSYGLQKIVPDHIRGRIFAFDGMLVTFTFGTVQPADGLARGDRSAPSDDGRDHGRRRGRLGRSCGCGSPPTCAARR